uniref:Transcription factor protein n=1 Tax=Phallusia mammillata TaxID=59560 RepID=A0A6F9DE60_9ASCI|nr:transcription factor protein [Phallusia mammillata]
MSQCILFSPMKNVFKQVSCYFNVLKRFFLIAIYQSRFSQSCRRPPVENH